MMNKIKFLRGYIVLAILLFLFGCGRDAQKGMKEKEDRMPYYILTYVNKTNKKISLTTYEENEIVPDLTISINALDKYTFRRGRESFAFFNPCSTRTIVNFNDEYEITHYGRPCPRETDRVRDNQIYPDTDPLRSLFNEKAYDIDPASIAESNDYPILSYTFTEQDYLEAKERGRKTETQK